MGAAWDGGEDHASNDDNNGSNWGASSLLHTILSTLQNLTYLIFITTLQGGHFDYPHFITSKMKAQRG